MIDITSYILSGMSVFPKTTAVVNGVTVPCIFNQSVHRDNKTYGGFEPDDEFILTIETSLLTSPKSLKGKTVTIEGKGYRVLVVRYGQIVTHLTVVSLDKA